MRRRSILLLCVLLVSCNRTPPPPPEAPPDSGQPEMVTEKEHLAWGQHAADAEELSKFRYAVYVDGARVVVTASCDSKSPTTTYMCTAPLPPMSPGTHTLALASFVDDGRGVLESSRSGPIRLTVAPSDASTGSK